MKWIVENPEERIASKGWSALSISVTSAGVARVPQTTIEMFFQRGHEEVVGSVDHVTRPLRAHNAAGLARSRSHDAPRSQVPRRMESCYGPEGAAVKASGGWPVGGRGDDASGTQHELHTSAASSLRNPLEPISSIVESGPRTLICSRPRVTSRTGSTQGIQARRARCSTRGPQRACQRHRAQDGARQQADPRPQVRANADARARGEEARG